MYPTSISIPSGTLEENCSEILESRKTTTAAKLNALLPLINRNEELLCKKGRMRNKLRSALLDPDFLKAHVDGFSELAKLFDRFRLFSGNSPDDAEITLILLEKAILDIPKSSSDDGGAQAHPVPTFTPQERGRLLGYFATAFMRDKSDEVYESFDSVHKRHIEKWKEESESDSVFISEYLIEVRTSRFPTYYNPLSNQVIQKCATDIIQSENIENIDNLFFLIYTLERIKINLSWAKELPMREAFSLLLNNLHSHENICRIGLIKILATLHIKLEELNLKPQSFPNLLTELVNSLLKEEPRKLQNGLKSLMRFCPTFCPGKHELPQLVDSLRRIQKSGLLFNSLKPLLQRLSGILETASRIQIPAHARGFITAGPKKGPSFRPPLDKESSARSKRGTRNKY